MTTLVRIYIVSLHLDPYVTLAYTILVIAIALWIAGYPRRRA
jgi:phosphate starvation-inducible membrane PsiE